MNAQQIIKGGIGLLVRQLLSIPCNFVGTLFCSFLLIPSDFATQAFFLPAIAISLLLTDLGVSKGLVLIPNGITLKDFIFSTLFKFTISLILFFSLNFYFISAYSYLLPTNDTINLLSYCTFVSLIQSVRNTMSSILQRELEWQRVARTELIEVVIYNIFLVISAYILKSPACFIIALLARHISGICFMSMQSLSLITNKDRYLGTIKILKNSSSRGLPLEAISIIGILNGLLIPVIGSKFLSMSEIGYLSWATSIASLITLVLRPVPDFLTSVFSSFRRQNKELGDKFNLFFDLLNFLSLISGLIFIQGLEIAFYYNVFTVWEPAKIYCYIFGISNLCIFPVLLISAQLSASGKSLLWLKTNLLGCALLWILCPFFTQNYQCIGFSLAWLLSTVIASYFITINAGSINKTSLDIIQISMPPLILTLLAVIPELHKNDIVIHSCSIILGLLLMSHWILSKRNKLIDAYLLLKQLNLFEKIIR